MPVNVGDGALASIRRGRTNGGRTPADGGFRTKGIGGTSQMARTDRKEHEGEIFLSLKKKYPGIPIYEREKKV